MNQPRHPRRAAALVAALSLLVQPSAPAIAAATPQAQPAAKPASPPSQTTKATTPTASKATPASAASAPAPVDGGWPRIYDLPSGGSILLYQPQIASWEKQAHIVAFSAVSYRSKTDDKPAMGTIKLEVGYESRPRRAAGQLQTR